MDSYTECKHGEVLDDAFACTPCALESGRAERTHVRGLGDLEPLARAEARFTGPCPSCEDWIAEGDPIVLIDDDWVCAEVCGT